MSVDKKALDEIAKAIAPWDDGEWTDMAGILERIGNIVASTGRKIENW